MQHKRRMKWPLRLLLGMVLLLALTLAGLFGWLATGHGQRSAQDLVKHQLSEAVGYDITAEGLRFAFPLRARMERLTLADARGIWLEAEGVALSVLPSPVMHKRLVLQSLSAKHLSLLRLPEQETQTGQDSEPGGLDVSVMDMAIDAVSLPPDVTKLPEETNAALTGELGWKAGEEKLTAALSALLHSGLPGLAESKLEAKLGLDIAENKLQLEDISLAHPALHARGQAALNLAEDSIEATLEAELAQLSHIAAGLSGQAKASATLSGPLDAIRLAADIHAGNLAYAQTKLPDTDATLKATLAEPITGTLEAKTADGGAGHTQFSYAAPALSLSNLAAHYREAVLKANLSLDTDTLLSTGTAQLEIPSIAAFTGFLPPEFSETAGSLSATAKLAAQEQAQAAAITAQGAKLRTAYGDAAKLEANLRFADISAGLPDNAVLAITGAEYAGITVQHATLAASRKGRDWQGEFAAHGDTPKPFSLAASGSVKLTEEGGYAVTLPALKGSFDKHPLRATRPVRLESGPQGLSLAAPGFTYGRGRYALKASQQGQQVSAALNGKQIAASDFMATPPKELQSARAALEAALSGTLEKPELKAELSATGLQLAEKTPPARLNAQAALASGKASLEAKVTQASATSNIAASLPVNFSLQPFAFDIAPDAPLSGKAGLAMDITSLAALLLPAPHTLSGHLDADVSVSGTLEKPVLSGPITFSKGRYTYPVLGVELSDMAAKAQARGTDMVLESFTASDGKGHTLSGSGRASLPSASALAYEANFSTRNFILLRHPNVRGTLSGELALSGDAEGGKLSGRLQNEQLEINLPSRIVTEVPELNITRQLPPRKKNAAPMAAPNPGAYPLALDVVFNAPHKVFVRGWGLDAELQGNLAVQGQAAKPEITGKLSTIRGRYEEFGKTFIIKTAELLFEGDIPPSPFLTVEAAINADGVEVRPVISGPVMEPSLKIESTPSMPQEEALSLLLFGRESGKLSAFQAVQLADSLRKLTGHGGQGFDAIGRLRKLIGVDDITIKNENDADPSVGVGKYIGDNVYLQVEGGAAESSGRASVEVELTPSISVESATGATGAATVGVNWKKDY